MNPVDAPFLVPRTNVEPGPIKLTYPRIAPLTTPQRNELAIAQRQLREAGQLVQHAVEILGELPPRMFITLRWLLLAQKALRLVYKQNRTALSEAA